jgi:hypothetical protein
LSDTFTCPDLTRRGDKYVTVDGFTGFKTATVEELPDAVAVRTRSMS